MIHSFNHRNYSSQLLNTSASVTQSDKVFPGFVEPQSANIHITPPLSRADDTVADQEGSGDLIIEEF